jgi:hypothetical protein
MQADLVLKLIGSAFDGFERAFGLKTLHLLSLFILLELGDLLLQRLDLPLLW